MIVLVALLTIACLGLTLMFVSESRTADARQKEVDRLTELAVKRSEMIAQQGDQIRRLTLLNEGFAKDKSLVNDIAEVVNIIAKNKCSEMTSEIYNLVGSRWLYRNDEPRDEENGSQS